jgi:hypothetical protein
MKPSRLTRITRAITGFHLRRLIKKNLSKSEPDIIELGGANSCFLEGLNASLHPSRYTIIDNNSTGLKKTGKLLGTRLHIHLVNNDVLNPSFRAAADIVLSIGLIEHFTLEGTRQAIRTHFALAAEGGLVIISFPTPTFLYRVSRKISELLGLWMFPDERPLTFDEVLRIVSELGEVLDRKIIWPIFLTQGIVLIRKRSDYSLLVRTSDQGKHLTS